MADADVTRRTWLAAERTWLAWWRTALGASVAALALGRLVPELTGEDRWPFAILGAGYGLLAVAMFVLAGVRWRTTEGALERGQFSPLDRRLVSALGLAGALLALATVVLLFV